MALKVKLANFTTWKIGGIANNFWQPKNVSEIKRILAEALNQKKRVIWFGGGSNILFADDVYDSFIINTRENFAKIKKVKDFIFAESGASLAKLIHFCLENNFLPPTFLIGIPGTIGGALRMNAGGRTNTIWNICEKIMTINLSGKLHLYNKNDLQIAYRKIILPDNEWILGAFFHTNPLIDKSKAIFEMKTLLEKKKLSQPIYQKTCGSVFKNPENKSAWQLIKEVGLQGQKHGGAIISNHHANFIENVDNATFEDVLFLVSLVQKEVWQKFQIKLEPEFKIIRDH